MAKAFGFGAAKPQLTRWMWIEGGANRGGRMDGCDTPASFRISYTVVRRQNQRQVLPRAPRREPQRRGCVGRLCVGNYLRVAG